jgi:methyl-accepting chemotaxis protein
MEKGLKMETTVPIPRFRRRRYLIKTRFQLRYVGLILALIIITGCICCYVVYYTSLITLGEKLAAVYPQGRLVAIVQMVNFRILLSIILMTPFIIMIGIYFSHRVAGPIFRTERFLKDMAAGDLSQDLILRKGDELISLADGINDVRNSLISAIDNQKERLDALLGKAEDLKALLPAKFKEDSEVRSLLDDIIAEIKAFRAVLDKYKLRK